MNRVLGKKQVYVTGSKIKIGARGKEQDPAEVLASVTKGEARKIRKSLRKMGRSDLAAIRRSMDGGA